MAQADWTVLPNSISADIVKGVVGGGIGPNGGGNFVYGMRTLAVVTGAVALCANQTNFDPTPTGKGGSIRGAVKRALSSGSTGFQPLLFIGCQGNDVNANAYILGLTDGDPFNIVLVKGAIVNGVPSVAPGAQGVLKKSTISFPIGTWLHLRLDMQVNTNGDTVLTCFQNDLGANLVSAPTWVAIPGIDQLIDDALGANTGTLPFTTGRMGYGSRFADVGRVAYFDQLEAIRQL